MKNNVKKSAYEAEMIWKQVLLTNIAHKWAVIGRYVMSKSDIRTWKLQCFNWDRKKWIRYRSSAVVSFLTLINIDLKKRFPFWNTTEAQNQLYKYTRRTFLPTMLFVEFW